MDAFIATLCKFAWSNCRKEDGITCFHNELHVATATVNISYANDVAGVWDLNLYVYPAPIGPLFTPSRPRFLGPGRVLGQTDDILSRREGRVREKEIINYLLAATQRTTPSSVTVASFHTIPYTTIKAFLQTYVFTKFHAKSKQTSFTNTGNNVTQ